MCLKGAIAMVIRRLFNGSWLKPVFRHPTSRLNYARSQTRVNCISVGQGSTMETWEAVTKYAVEQCVSIKHSREIECLQLNAVTALVHITNRNLLEDYNGISVNGTWRLLAYCRL